MSSVSSLRQDAAARRRGSMADLRAAPSPSSRAQSPCSARRRPEQSRRRSTSDLFATGAPPTVQRSPSGATGRPGLGVLAGSARQAARLDNGFSPRHASRREVLADDPDLADAPRRSSSHSRAVRPADPSSEFHDWHTQAIAGFMRTPPRRASLLALKLLALSKPSQKEEHEAPGILEADDAAGSEGSGAPDEKPDDVRSSEETDSDEPHVPLAPTLLEIYSGYAEETAETHDRFMRLAFKRFEAAGAGEIGRERLHDALTHLGFLTSTREHSLELAAKLSKFQNLDYVDFCDYVSKFAADERSGIRQRACACAEGGGTTALDRIQEFLRSAGVFISNDSVEVARKAAKLDHMKLEDMSTNDLLLTLAACRLDESFTKEELAEAFEIFGELEKEQHVSPNGWGRLAKASQLTDGMLQFTGLYSVDYIEQMADILPSDTEEQPGFCFHEFLVWLRRLRDPMTQDLWKRFKDLETSEPGLIQRDSAITIAKQLGISLLADAVNELMLDLGLQENTTFDFDSLVQFISAARKTHGFSRSEAEELGTAYEKMDYEGTGELNIVQVLDLLRYLGNTTSVDAANAMIKRVDFNGNGSMDRDEFLRLMRLMREQDCLKARKSFDDLSSSTEQLPRGSVKDALAKLHLSPKDDLLEELMQNIPGDVCFTSFMRLHDQCRFRMNLEFRKCGGFPEATTKEIAELWSPDGSPKKFATFGELIWMFSDSQEVPVNTSDGRSELQRRVMAARESAIAAGVSEEEASREGTADIGFYTFVHLIRGLVRDSEQDVIKREKEAVSAARFPSSEAAEFRTVFSDLAEQEAKKVSSRKKRPGRTGQSVDKLLANLTMVPSIPETGVLSMLKSIGVNATASKMAELKDFLTQTRSRYETDKHIIQFATFLRMLRWMLDTDFASICSVMKVPKE
ncbi:unnamed protein product [Prorocentrum cordatum]|uniref:Calmodulin n=1 Tax=Prorocentrum cordatum TaxID=2364126 RepID=A0ABN9VEQ1_9DINO|nr:unnamed protein product [Polarella glacialis]